MSKSANGHARNLAINDQLAIGNAVTCGFLFYRILISGEEMASAGSVFSGPREVEVQAPPAYINKRSRCWPNDESLVDHRWRIYCSFKSRLA